jgi:glutamate--cysteine ligase
LSLTPSKEPLHARLRRLGPGLLRKIQRGIEKESLRVRPDGALALTPHPLALGSALCHPNITTDFSESQLELITGVHDTVEGCLTELTLIHQAVFRAIGEETLWCASMPCGLPDEATIPLGRYGTSNVGMAKTVYRNGLAHRYGRRMQMISGIHYNFSLPPEAWKALDWPGGANDAYFALLRNFRRHAWLCFYLFGASPAVCPSFVEGRDHGLQALSRGTMYLPHATSLRMGRLGYQSDAQASILASFNSLEAYAFTLEPALITPYPPYEAIGIRKGDEYLQLQPTLLQIENEFYGKIRPKRTIKSGERPLHALRERGVEYVEVRLMDLDPFEPIGINAATIRLLDIFLLHCLLTPSPTDTPHEIVAIARNQERVAARGREPGLALSRDGVETPVFQWGGELLMQCEPIAEALDEAWGGKAYREVLSSAVEALDNPEAVPSARVLDEVSDKFDAAYTRFALTHSVAHRETILKTPFSADAMARFDRMAKESLAEQKQIEDSDSMTFEEYRRQYLDPGRLQAKPVTT